MQIQSQVEQVIHDFIQKSLDDINQEDIKRHFDGQLSADTVVTTLASLEDKEFILRHGDGVYTLNPKISGSGIELVLLG